MQKDFDDDDDDSVLENTKSSKNISDDEEASPEQKDWIDIVISTRDSIKDRLDSDGHKMEPGEVAMMVETLHRLFAFHVQAKSFDKSTDFQDNTFD